MVNFELEMKICKNVRKSETTKTETEPVKVRRCLLPDDSLYIYHLLKFPLLSAIKVSLNNAYKLLRKTITNNVKRRKRNKIKKGTNQTLANIGMQAN